MLQQEFDEPPLAGLKVAVDPSSGKTMQDGDGLLGQQLFKFIGGHRLLVVRDGCSVISGECFITLFFSSLITDH